MRGFALSLSDPGRSFYCSGEKLSGSVRLEAAHPCRLTRLRLTAAGCARVEHRGGKNRRTRSQEEEYLRYEEDLRLEEQLPRDPEGYFLLQSDKKYSFQFSFELPAAGHLVSSYEGKYGYVRYYVRAGLEGPSQNALQCEKAFTVEEPLDINRPDLLAPAAASKQKKVTCMFIPDGQVSISARIDRKGFCEGEDISITAKFENTCSRIVVPKAAIIAKHSYVASGHVKEVRQKLSTVRGNHIIAGMCDMWQGRSIRIPKLKPSLLDCDIIKVEYALMVYLHIPGSEKLMLELPLVMGTVPFRGVGSRTSSMSSWSSLPSAPPSYINLRGADPFTPLLRDYDGGEDEEEEGGGLSMRPPERSHPTSPT
ncbi:thioredoxin-interacting protein-like [Spinachia spinachia]